MDFIELHGNRVYMGARPLFYNAEYELHAELEQRYVPALQGEGVRAVAVLMPMEEIQRHYGQDICMCTARPELGGPVWFPQRY